MKIGIISDTHKKTGRAKKAIDMLLENGATFLIHAGDIGKEETLEYMAQSGVPYVAVLGNNDRHLAHLTQRYELFKEPHYFKIKDISVKLMHHPWFLTPDADLVVFGHTHTFSVDVRVKTKAKNGTIFINPGEVCARNKPISEAVLLDVFKDKWQVTHCQRRIKDRLWHFDNRLYTHL